MLLKRLFAGVFVSGFDVFPVNDVPNGLQIVGLDVLVLKIESVLPNINSYIGSITKKHYYSALPRRGVNPSMVTGSWFGIS